MNDIVTREMVDTLKDVLTPARWRSLSYGTKRMLCETLSGEITPKVVERALEEIKKNETQKV